MTNEQIRFIDSLYKDLYLDDVVTRNGKLNKYDKFKNINEYFKRLDLIHRRVTDTGRHSKLLREMYHHKYVIRPEDIPESYYRHQQEIALERGFGYLEITPDIKYQYQQQIINDQKSSLDVWINYFLSKDADVYPFWAKYWAFQGMLKLGVYDKETGEFTRRTKVSIAPFVDLNREALAISIDLVINSLNGQEVDDKKLNELVKSGSFGKIYSYVINFVLNGSNNKDIMTKKNDGMWIKYEQGSDHIPLVNSLRGYNTGWCTAGESTAKAQLENGDFYVYYTLDENNEYKVPRIAIRMEWGEIAEIRGIEENQNIEPEMESVVEEKIKEFPDSERYFEKLEDMKLLTKIHRKHMNEEELTKEELIFLYEINDEILGFGYYDDPRISEIKNARNKRKDLSLILDSKEDEVEYIDANINANTKFFYGDLIVRGRSYLENFKFPNHIIRGDLSLPSVIHLSNVTFPESVDGVVDLNSLETAKGVTLPKKISLDLILSDLKSAEGLILPESIGKFLYLSSLKDANGLILPDSLNCYIYFKRLENAAGLILPSNLQGVSFSSLKSAEGLVLPQIFNGSLYFASLTSPDGLVLPRTMLGGLDLCSLLSCDGLIFPERVHSLNLDSLTSVDGLILPKQIDKFLSLQSIESIDDLTIPTPLTYKIYLKNVTITPDNVDEYINNTGKKK